MRRIALVGWALVGWAAACGSSEPGEARAPAASGAPQGALGRGSATGAQTVAPPKLARRKRTGAMFVTEHDVTLRVQMEAEARRKAFASQAESDPKGTPILARRDDGCYTNGPDGAPTDAACPAAYDDPAWDNCPDGVLYAVDPSECYCEAAAVPKAGARPIWRNACPKKLRGK